MSKSGTCKWFNVKRGFGFIECADGSGDHFCHQEDIQKDGFRKLVEGQQVTYDLGSDNKGNIKAVAVSAGAMPKRPRRKRKPRSD